ncbi:hypothetical protein ZHAS_00017556 [Anopheles sinensis]|uniref:Uncharacterized protein n=1 Tax=Anopheles sinensis TaxID=74873 RepID=A0A084WGW8_ANOSI|nr:hypothetical protein ZHAS_00017556 [Anopheles sinensis]
MGRKKETEENHFHDHADDRATNLQRTRLKENRNLAVLQPPKPLVWTLKKLFRQAAEPQDHYAASIDFLFRNAIGKRVGNGNSYSTMIDPGARHDQLVPRSDVNLVPGYLYLSSKISRKVRR